MIEIKELKDSDKGRIVVYKANNSKPQKGTITSWNDHYIFVDYYATGRGTATMPFNLTYDKTDVLLTDLENEINEDTSVTSQDS